MLFFIHNIYYQLIYTYVFAYSFLHQILVYLSMQKTKELNKYLPNEYNHQSVYLKLPKIIFLLGNKITNSVQRYIIPESCSSFQFLTNGRRNTGSQSCICIQKVSTKFSNIIFIIYASKGMFIHA